MTTLSNDAHSFCLYCKKSVLRIPATGSLGFGLSPASRQPLVADQKHIYSCEGQKLIHVKITSIPEGVEDVTKRKLWIDIEFWTWKKNLLKPLDPLIEEHLMKKFPVDGDLHLPSKKIILLLGNTRAINWWTEQSVPKNREYRKILRKGIGFSSGCFKILEEKFYSEELAKSIV